MPSLPNRVAVASQGGPDIFAKNAGFRRSSRHRSPPCFHRCVWIPFLYANSSLHLDQRAFIFLLAFGLFTLPPASGSQILESPSGVVVSLDGETGSYSIQAKVTGWSFSGKLGGSPSEITVQRGQDGIGQYQELGVQWQEQVSLSGSIRVYDVSPIVVFGISCTEARRNLPTPFPRFTAFPRDLHHFSFRDFHFAPASFDLEQTGTPWLFFDQQDNSVVLSPADNFMVARMIGDGVREIASGFNEGLNGLPAHFTHRTLMVFGRGINATWDTWGRALTDLHGKVRPPNDADIGLRYLGYWTDNGAFYYYNYEPALGYAGTLEALVHHYRTRGIPIRYLQLDSWWYFKTLTDYNGKPGHRRASNLPEGEWNRFGGLLKYTAHPGVLPDGLAGFQKKIGLPLITHNRWIDPESPYRKDYRITGYAAIDPRWWDDIISYIHASGVASYEQDWLDVIYNHSPELATTVDAGDAFTDNMARACKAMGVTMQYCMALPRYFLQGARYDNLTTIRVSGDRFKRKFWDPFLYTSRLASAVGVWPWSDVFMSTETDNLLMATLSAGMVGIGDAMGRESKENLSRVARADGVLVKPDVPLVPVDEMYWSEARGTKPPMVAWTHTDHGSLRTVYVLAYNRGDGRAEAGFKPSEFGFAGQVYVCDMRTNTAVLLSATERFDFALEEEATAYFVLAPFGRAGIAFFGDDGKFVSNGRQRIAALADEPGKFTATVTFAEGENSVRVFGYALKAPRAEALSGSVGDAKFEAASGRFELTVSPAPEIIHNTPGDDPIQSAVIVLYTN